MKKISRILVSLFAVVLWQSSLGTKAAQINAQNLGQNGYRKYEDGFIIQWGYYTLKSDTKTIYLNISFYDNNYCVIANLFNGSPNYSQSVVISAKEESFFKTIGKSVGLSAYGPATEPVFWLAVGRWKK